MLLVSRQFLSKMREHLLRKCPDFVKQHSVLAIVVTKRPSPAVLARLVGVVFMQRSGEAEQHRPQGEVRLAATQPDRP
jgi:hypothetical protein